MFGKALGVAALGLSVVSAEAPAADRVQLAWRFGHAQPGVLAPVDLHLRYRPADGSDGKATPVEALTIEAPEGTRYDTADRPRCDAEDVALRLLGRAACPEGSRIGSGTLTADTGAGAPVDPAATEVSIYATASGFLEIAQLPGTNVTLGIDRFTISGSRLTGRPPVVPGGPPDGRTAVREVAFRFAPVFRTPPRCPPAGWVTTTQADFADGATARSVTTQPCRPDVQAPVVDVRPRRVRARRASRVRVTVRTPAGDPVAGARVSVLGRRASTGADGVATFVLHPLRPGLRVVRVRADDRPPADARLRVRARRST